MTNYSALHHAEVSKRAAEGTDAQAQSIGLEHSAKTYAEQAAISAATASPPPLFKYDWYEYLIDDERYLRCDTFSWHPGGTYSNCYDHLVNDIDGVSPSTETVGGYTVTYYQATDGHKICLPDQESTILNIYNAIGVAWYYILDTANTRFKLPRENPTREVLGQSAPVIGNGIALGLTNGTDNLGALNYGDGVQVFKSAYGKDVGDDYGNVGVTVNKTMGITTDTTKSGMIAKLSETTGFYKGKQYLYCYVGQFSQTATEQTAGLNSELFNGKVDLDLDNMNPSSSAKETIVGWGMPDYSSAVSLTASPYTAPANGFIAICNYGTNPSVELSVNNVLTFNTGIAATGSVVSCFIPVMKNDVVTYSGGGANSWKYFIPMKGVQNA